jgi:hypothetical protein
LRVENEAEPTEKAIDAESRTGSDFGSADDVSTPAAGDEGASGVIEPPGQR